MKVKIEENWNAALSREWESEYFAELVAFVKNEYSRTRIFPPAREIFAAFDACPFDRVKVVILGQDPYHGDGQANGLCFSVRQGIELPPSLINIYKEIGTEYGRPDYMPPSGDLSRWARQGVLLLNATLTVEAHRAGSHQGHGWERFTDAAIEALNYGHEHLVFMLWGSYAIRKGALVDRNRHLVLTSPHPSPLSAYRGFFGNGHFIKANEYLAANGREPIKWIEE
ncbi:MAG: uracil-DNA glycosylase [Muribaculaceae bacterium]|jgi:uracil-DNA glycosylase